MTTAELIERAKRQLNAGQPQPHIWPDSEIEIAATIHQATNDVAYAVMMDDSRRTLLQQQFSVSLSGAGEGDLLAATGSVTGNTGEILVEGVRYGVVKDNDNNILRHILHYLDFLGPYPPVYAYYNIRNRATIATRAISVPVNGPADIQSVNGPLIITANYEPRDVDDFPPELEVDVVDALCQRVLTKINAQTG